MDLTEVLLETNAHTGFADEFCHASEACARVDNLPVSINAVLMAEACNIGLDLSSLTAANEKPRDLPVLLLPYTMQYMCDLGTYFSQSLSTMMTRKSIDTVLLSVAVDTLSQRQWNWFKLMKPMEPPPAMVASAILEHRHDTAAPTRLQDTGE